MKNEKFKVIEYIRQLIFVVDKELENFPKLLKNCGYADQGSIREVLDRNKPYPLVKAEKCFDYKIKIDN